MAYYPFSPRNGDFYVLQGADGTRVSFNDVSDPDYVGMVTEITGLDSPDVREAFTDLIGADGGSHGDFFFGRRPIALTGSTVSHSSQAIRDLRLSKLRRATNALRSDATLTWKPISRTENLLLNPGFETNTNSWAIYQNAATGTLSRTTAQFRSGTAAAQIAVTAGGAGSSLGVATTVASAAAAYPGQVFSTAGYMRSSVSRQAQSILAFYTSAGTFISSTSGATTASSTTAWTRTPALTATAPASAAWVTAYVSFNAVAAGENHYVDDVMLNTGASVNSYFDGSTTGFYWQGTPHASASGDYIEMYTPIRLQNRRYSGAWAKEFQLGLVSEYAPVFSSNVSSVTGSGVTVENRGDWPAYPIFRITGSAVNPSVTVDSTDTAEANYVVSTTGLTLAAGETVELDMLNHTATFVAGARNGQSANRYIDFAATTRWPVLQYGLSTVTLGGGGTLTTLWRDAWA